MTRLIPAVPTGKRRAVAHLHHLPLRSVPALPARRRWHLGRRPLADRPAALQAKLAAIYQGRRG